MLKKWTIFIFILILLSGCSGITGKNDFAEKINAIEQALKAEDWKQLKSLGDDLDQLYHGSQWKIQLLGDEDEYESLQESINHLMVAIGEQDLTEAKLEVATIKTYMEDIYSL
jgi:hypothetical protein